MKQVRQVPKKGSASYRCFTNHGQNDILIYCRQREFPAPVTLHWIGLDSVAHLGCSQFANQTSLIAAQLLRISENAACYAFVTDILSALLDRLRHTRYKKSEIASFALPHLVPGLHFPSHSASPPVFLLLINIISHTPSLYFLSIHHSYTIHHFLALSPVMA